LELDRYILCNPVSSIKGILSRVCMAIMLLFVVAVFICTTAGAEELHVGSEEVYSTISGAVDAASEGDVIIVHAGNYIENVDVNKRLDLRGAGADVVTVTAVDPNDHVFDVCASRVNISGFTVTGATGYYPCLCEDNEASGIILHPFLFRYPYNNTLKNRCNIFDNNILKNRCGISLASSSYNILTNNNISNNICGINLFHFYTSPCDSRLPLSNYNTLTDNTVNSNEKFGIVLHSSSNNSISNNTINLNGEFGIGLFSETFCYDYYMYEYEQICLNNPSNYNTLINNTINSNNLSGIYLSDCHHNTFIGNTANSNKYHGVNF